MATGKSSQEIYILLQEHATITNSPSLKKNFFKKSLKTKKKDKNESKSAQYVPAGSLLRKDLDTEKQEVYLSLSEGCSISCASSAVAELSDEEYKLLEGIHPCAERIKRYNLKTKGKKLTSVRDDAFLNELKKIQSAKSECSGGMVKNMFSKSMDCGLDDILRSESTSLRSAPHPTDQPVPPALPKTNVDIPKSVPTERPPCPLPQPALVSFDKSPSGSSGSHSSSGRTWRRTTGPEEDDDRKFNIPPDEGSDVEDICIDDEHYFSDVPGQVNIPPDEGSDVEDICIDDEHYFSDVPGQVNIPPDEGSDVEDICIHDEHYSNAVPGQVRETIPVASDEEEEDDLDPDLAVKTEPLYVNLPHPVQAGAVASTVKDEDVYGIFSPRGFCTDHNAVFAPCERRLREPDHHYEGIQFTAHPDDIFDQSYPLDPEQQYTGTCVIINQFTHDREGSYIDVQTIYELFEGKFKFRIDYQSNLSKKEFLGTFKKHHDYMANPDNRVQRFICFILGHGDEKGIMTCVGGLGSRFHAEEGARIDVNKDLLPFLNSSNLKTMAGKPKLMFIQACRGRAFQGGHRVQGEADPHDGIGETVDLNVAETIPPPHVSIPNDSDILVAYAQTPGKQAFRDMRVGSWFIQAVTDIFRAYHERYDVLSMMTMVSNAVSYMSRQNPDGSEHKQSPIIQHTLRKKMFMLRASA
ncbi:uncharacterized protein LOC135496340 isoform X2 [Lineus longissimus]|uniref:uncharacterized protein LOC135496340 isoform X2 n=1 Tax=Lineus longissimus TaxID=88925 RepID=UPI00315D8D76